MKILEIGPAAVGPTQEVRLAYPGAVTVDSVPRPGIDHVATWGAEPLPFPDGTFQLVYASHVLEHVPWYQTEGALREALRVLSLGGALEVWVPDFAKIIVAYHEWRSCGRFPAGDWTPFNERRDGMLWVAGRLFCGTRDEDSSWHRAMFDEVYLENCFCRAGFVAIRHITTPPSGQVVDHGGVDCGVFGVKL